MQYQWFELKRKDGSKLKCSHCTDYFDSLYIIAFDLDDAMQMLEGALCGGCSSIDMIVSALGPHNVTLIEV